MEKLPLRRRNHLFDIAMDYYGASGEPLLSKLAIIIQDIMNAVHSAGNFPSLGFILSTALTVLEIISVLQSIGVKLSAFDALICSSGSQLLYTPGDRLDSTIYPDPYYDSHIDYHWGAEVMRKLRGPHNS